MTLKDNTKPALFKASFTFPSCTNICVLTDYDIELPIDPQTLELDEEAMFLFNQGMSQSPREANRTSVNGLFWDKSKQQLVTQLTSKEGWDKPMVLIDGQEVLDDFFSPPTVHITDNTMTAVFDVSNWIGEVDLTDRTVSITVSDTNFAEEMTAQVGSDPIAYQTSNNSFLVMLGFALVGGLILNIMPCVLPVLGMKLNSIIQNQVLQTATSDSHS